VLDGKAAASSTGDEATTRGGAGVLGTRKRPALGDLTNAKASRANVAGPSGASGLEKRAATTSGTTLKEAGTSRVRAAPAAASTTATTKVRAATSASASSRTAAGVRAGTVKREPIDDTRVTKRPRVDVAAAAHQAHLLAQQASVPVGHAQAKDEGWEDLDAEDADDPLMVAEYVNEIFVYMKQLEVSGCRGGGAP
jgi:G2/mitotic-specific cyclin 1/2